MDQLHRLRTLHLFAGAGGGILADLLLGHRPVCAVEINPYCQRVLMQRQADGALPWFPIWDDVCTFDGHPWRGVADVVAGGFPCQDISSAGKQQGLSGARSGLWSEFARIVGEVRPRYAFIENVPDLAVRGLNRVLSDLATLGMDVRWCCLGADDVGAPHIRKRLWILATDTNSDRMQQRLPTAGEGWRPVEIHDCRIPRSGNNSRYPETWAPEPSIYRVDDGVANSLDRYRAIGNGQVPQCAAKAWRILIAGGQDEQQIALVPRAENGTTGGGAC